MANRYQSFSFTTASVASGVVLQASQVLGPHCYNLVKLKIVRNTGAGNINFRIFKKGVWGSANRLIRFENQVVPLVQPVDKTSGSPGVEALEGVPLPVDDEDGTNNDGTGKLHYELENLGTTSTFTISGEYEEVVVLSGAGDPSWRGAITALTSVSLRGATSGVVTIQVGAAAAGTWTLKLPTTGGTADYALTTDGTGISSWVLGQSIAGLKTSSTPQFARLGLGAAADAAYQLRVIGPAGVTSFTGTPKLGVLVDGSSGTTDYSGIDFVGNSAGSSNTPIGRIALLTTGGGSSLKFGTSNNYSNGITNTALTIDPAGNLIVASIIAIGTNPAASGDIRLANNAGITARNAANSGDYQLIRLNTNNQTELGVSGNDIAVTTTLALGPTPATTGRIRLTNADLIYARNAANNANKGVIGLNASDQVEISTDGQDIKWGRALVALGGGAAPTVGTIGGSGPATAAQNTWMKVIDSTGAAFYVPAWK